MLAPGRYLTDGRRLFRVMSSITSSLYPSAELEDCLTLQVEHYSPGELYRMHLRPVRPSAQQSA